MYDIGFIGNHTWRLYDVSGGKRRVIFIGSIAEVSALHYTLLTEGTR